MGHQYSDPNKHMSTSVEIMQSIFILLLMGNIERIKIQLGQDEITIVGEKKI
jgi:hypothetical protein